MKDMTIFNNTEFGTLTIIEKDGEPWFIAKEISDILGYAETSVMNRRLDDDEKTNMPFRSVGSNYQTNKTVINESGFYSAALGSKKPEAKAFKKWVTSEVLPEIRKTGGYTTPKTKSVSNAKIASNFNANLRIAKLLGFEGNQAILSANRVTRREDGVDLIESFGANLINEKQVQYFTPTELGKQAGGLSAVKVNKLLADKGYQVETRGGGNKLIWKVTDSGKRVCQIIDTGKKHSNGTPVQQCKWQTDVIDVLV